MSRNQQESPRKSRTQNRPAQLLNRSLLGFALAIGAVGCHPSQLRFSSDFTSATERRPIRSGEDGTIGFSEFRFKSASSSSASEALDFGLLAGRSEREQWFGFRVVGTPVPWEGACTSTAQEGSGLISLGDDKNRRRVQVSGEGRRLREPAQSVRARQVGGWKSHHRLSGGRTYLLDIVPHTTANGNMWLNVPPGHRPGYRMELSGRTIAAIQMTDPYTTWMRRDLGTLRAPVAVTLGAMFLWQRPEPPDQT